MAFWSSWSKKGILTPDGKHRAIGGGRPNPGQPGGVAWATPQAAEAAEAETKRAAEAEAAEAEE